METIVECYAGTRYPERPRALVWEGERLEVVEIEHQYRTPRGPGFRARTSDGRGFSLLYDEVLDAWDVQPWTST